MEIKTKEELNNLVIKLIQDKNVKTNDKKQVFSLIKNKIKELFLKEGDIPPSFYIKLYNFFYNENLEVSSDKFFEQNIKVLSDYYDSSSDVEKYLLNNVLFIFQFFEVGTAAVGEYIKRGLVLHTHQMAANQEGKYFINFFQDKNIKISDRLIIDTIKEYIQIDKFFNLDKISKRAIFVNLLSIVWNIPAMYNNKIWLTIFDDLVKLLDECIKRNMIEEQMYIHFFIYHSYGNNIQTIKEWEIFNQKVEKPSSKFYKKWGKEQKLKPCKNEISKGKKKIGFLFDRIVLNSPFMVEYSLFKALLNDEKFNKEYEIYVYSMNYVDKAKDDQNIINSLKALGIKFYSPIDFFVEEGYYYSHLNKALLLREQIIKDEIDYLVSGFGYDISNFIFSNRSAPKQVFWSHGNCTSEVENIDIRVSHFGQECQNHEWKIFNVPMATEFLVGSKEDKIKGELLKKSLIEGFGEDTVILGTIGRLVKIESEEYIRALSEIMKQNPNTIYLACGNGNKENVEKLMLKCGIDLKRVVFTGQVNPHIYGWVIDVWPDSFPLGQGQSKDEFIAKNRPVIFHIKRGVKRNNNNKVFIAKDDSEYIEFVSKLIKNKEKREEIAQLEHKLWFKNSDIKSFMKVLE